MNARNVLQRIPDFKIAGTCPSFNFLIVHKAYM